VVLPHGVLFRGAAEGHIRKVLIEQKNCLDAVIGLPANIFYGTSIPTCILVMKKQRTSDDVLFIDASAHFGKSTNQNILREEDIKRILNSIANREFKDKFAYVASLSEIKDENDFNLNMPRYVDTFEKEETVDIEGVVKQLSSIDALITKIDSEIELNCNELDLPKPFGDQNA